MSTRNICRKFQLFIYIFVWLVEGKFHMGMSISLSLIIVGKTSAENLHMNGEENKVNSLLTIIKYIPVLTLTALFRIGTLGIGLDI